MDLKQPNRRQFLKKGTVLAGLAVGGVRLARGETRDSPVPDERGFQIPYGAPSRFESITRITVPGQAPYLASGLTPIQDLVGMITPSSLHFYQVRFHDFPPAVDPRQHRLMIHGLVERPLSFSVDELKRLPSVSRVHLMECHGNTSWPGGYHNGFRSIQYSHGKTSCSLWTGVALSTLLREAGVKKEGAWVFAESADSGRHWKCIPMETAMDDVMVAYGQNSEALRPENGYPIRLLVPGAAGVNSVKYVRRIKVVDEFSPFSYGGSFRERDGKIEWWDFKLGVKSVITRPSSGQRLTAGAGCYEITGLAWAGEGAIRKVEVSLDAGRTWKDAQLHDPVLRKAHTRFTFPWTWDGQETIMQSRATDEHGTVQPSLMEFARIRRFTPPEPVVFRGFTTEFFKLPEIPPTQSMVNAIQPWRITREGSVENAEL